MATTLKGLFDRAKLQELTDHFFAATGIPVAVISAQGEVFTCSGSPRLCEELHRRHPLIELDCIAGDSAQGEQPLGAQPFTLYHCPGGLTKAAIPIMVEAGEITLGVAVVGPLFLERPDAEVEGRFRELARELGLDEEATAQALLEVLVVSAERLHPALQLLAGLTGIIAELGEQRWQAQSATEQLRESEGGLSERERSRLGAILESTSDLVSTSTPTTRLTYLNKAGRRLAGWAEDEPVEGRVIADLHPAWALRVIEERGLPEAARSGLWEGETAILHRSGREVPVSQVILAHHAPEGDLEYYSTIMRDVSAVKLSEKALRESEDRFRSIVESSPMGIHSYRLEGGERLVLTGANRAADQILGIDHEPLIGLTCEEAFPPLAETDIPARYRELAASGGTWKTAQVDYEDRRIRGAFEVIAFQTGPGRMTAMFLDITQRLQAEEALRESEAKFRSFAENLVDVLFITDVSGMIRYLSPSAQQVFGQGAEEMLNRPFPVLLPEHQIGEALKAFQATLQSGERTVEMALTMKRADGTEFPGELSASLLRRDDKVVGTLGLIRDVTERRRSEEERAVLEAQLQQAQKMESIGRLAGGVAHDFNNLLTGIMGNVELALMDIAPDDPLKEPLTEVNVAAESAAGLTAQLLAFSRKQVVAPQVINLNDLVSRSQKMLGRLIGEDINLRFLPNDGAGQVRVDPGQVEQILVNLVVNARDAMPTGGKLTLEIAAATLDDHYCRGHQEVIPGRYVMLAVSDDGVGMTEDVREHIFEPFFTTKERGKGTGLGLATVFGAVKQNGGNIEVYSEPGQGTTFKIYFPSVDAQPQALSQIDREEMPRGNETIYVVEDEEIVRLLAERVLRRQNYEVFAFSNGEEALAALEHQGGPVHLLITDVVMPGVNGRALAEQIMALVPDIRVLFTSGYTENVIVHHGVLEEGLEFLAKPYSPQTLAKKIRDVLDRGR